MEILGRLWHIVSLLLLLQPSFSTTQDLSEHTSIESEHHTSIEAECNIAVNSDKDKIINRCAPSMYTQSRVPSLQQIFESSLINCDFGIASHFIASRFSYSITGFGAGSSRPCVLSGNFNDLKKAHREQSCGSDRYHCLKNMYFQATDVHFQTKQSSINDKTINRNCGNGTIIIERLVSNYKFYGTTAPSRYTLKYHWNPLNDFQSYQLTFISGHDLNTPFSRPGLPQCSSSSVPSPPSDSAIDLITRLQSALSSCNSNSNFVTSLGSIPSTINEPCQGSVASNCCPVASGSSMILYDLSCYSRPSYFNSPVYIFGFSGAQVIKLRSALVVNNPMRTYFVEYTLTKNSSGCYFITSILIYLASCSNPVDLSNCGQNCPNPALAAVLAFQTYIAQRGSAPAPLSISTLNTNTCPISPNQCCQNSDSTTQSMFSLLGLDGIKLVSSTTPIVQSSSPNIVYLANTSVGMNTWSIRYTLALNPDGYFYGIISLEVFTMACPLTVQGTVYLLCSACPPTNPTAAINVAKQLQIDAVACLPNTPLINALGVTTQIRTVNACQSNPNQCCNTIDPLNKAFYVDLFCTQQGIATTPIFVSSQNNGNTIIAGSSIAVNGVTYFINYVLVKNIVTGQFIISLIKFGTNGCPINDSYLDCGQCIAINPVSIIVDLNTAISTCSANDPLVQGLVSIPYTTNTPCYGATDYCCATTSASSISLFLLACTNVISKVFGAPILISGIVGGTKLIYRATLSLSTLVGTLEYTVEYTLLKVGNNYQLASILIYLSICANPIDYNNCAPNCLQPAIYAALDFQQYIARIGTAPQILSINTTYADTCPGLSFQCCKETSPDTQPAFSLLGINGEVITTSTALVLESGSFGGPGLTLFATTTISGNSWIIRYLMIKNPDNFTYSFTGLQVYKTPCLLPLGGGDNYPACTNCSAPVTIEDPITKVAQLLNAIISCNSTSSQVLRLETIPSTINLPCFGAADYCCATTSNDSNSLYSLGCSAAGQTFSVPIYISGLLGDPTVVIRSTLTVVNGLLTSNYVVELTLVRSGDFYNYTSSYVYNFLCLNPIDFNNCGATNCPEPAIYAASNLQNYISRGVLPSVLSLVSDISDNCSSANLCCMTTSATTSALYSKLGITLLSLVTTSTPILETGSTFSSNPVYLVGNVTVNSVPWTIRFTLNLDTNGFTYQLARLQLFKPSICPFTALVPAYNDCTTCPVPNPLLALDIALQLQLDAKACLSTSPLVLDLQAKTDVIVTDFCGNNLLQCCNSLLDANADIYLNLFCILQGLFISPTVIASVNGNTLVTLSASILVGSITSPLQYVLQWNPETGSYDIITVKIGSLLCPINDTNGDCALCSNDPLLMIASLNTALTGCSSTYPLVQDLATVPSTWNDNCYGAIDYFCATTQPASSLLDLTCLDSAVSVFGVPLLASGVLGLGPVEIQSTLQVASLEGIKNYLVQYNLDLISGDYEVTSVLVNNILDLNPIDYNNCAPSCPNPALYAVDYFQDYISRSIIPPLALNISYTTTGKCADLATQCCTNSGTNTIGLYLQLGINGIIPVATGTPIIETGALGDPTLTVRSTITVGLTTYELRFVLSENPDDLTYTIASVQIWTLDCPLLVGGGEGYGACSTCPILPTIDKAISKVLSLVDGARLCNTTLLSPLTTIRYTSACSPGITCCLKDDDASRTFLNNLFCTLQGITAIPSVITSLNLNTPVLSSLVTVGLDLYDFRYTLLWDPATNSYKFTSIDIYSVLCPFLLSYQSCNSCPDSAVERIQSLQTTMLGCNLIQSLTFTLPLIPLYKTQYSSACCAQPVSTAESLYTEVCGSTSTANPYVFGAPTYVGGTTKGDLVVRISVPVYNQPGPLINQTPVFYLNYTMTWNVLLQIYSFENIDSLATQCPSLTGYPSCLDATSKVAALNADISGCNALSLGILGLTTIPSTFNSKCYGSSDYCCATYSLSSSNLFTLGCATGSTTTTFGAPTYISGSNGSTTARVRAALTVVSGGVTNNYVVEYALVLVNGSYVITSILIYVSNCYEIIDYNNCGPVCPDPSFYAVNQFQNYIKRTVPAPGVLSISVLNTARCPRLPFSCCKTESSTTQGLYTALGINGINAVTTTTPVITSSILGAITIYYEANVSVNGATWKIRYILARNPDLFTYRISSIEAFKSDCPLLLGIIDLGLISCLLCPLSLLG